MKTNRILFAVLFASILLLLYFYSGVVPYKFLSVTITLFVVSFVYSCVIFFRFKYSQAVDKKFIVKGEKVHFLFNISNEDFFLYPYIKVNLFGENTIFARQFQTKSFSLTPFSKRNFSFELQCKYRGCYELGIKSIEIEDFLGLFKFTYKISETKQINVMPQIVYLDRFSLETNFMSETNSMLDRKYEDLTAVSEIRDYVYGDSFKKIHWKLTAKSSSIKVKNFEGTSETSALLIVDLMKNNYDTDSNTILEDKLIESAVAVIYYCLSNWIPISVVYFKDKLVTIDAKNPLDFEGLYQVLSAVRFNGNVAVSDILDVFINDSTSRTNFIIFTSNINYELYSQLYITKVAGNNVSLVYISPEELISDRDAEKVNILNHMPEIGVNTYTINTNDNIKTVLERQL